ncbi:hypothetical protein CEXT_31161 [Caerostris extrusa]|uniref:Uncharacterized protein n=1 Tax=Caerostris extrusa TaxID=172846 RepID=A0AAV4XI50_CAEEX|nr:hypothetical protein CEXT_31161 [Caerostris extrusa]
MQTLHTCPIQFLTLTHFGRPKWWRIACPHGLITSSPLSRRRLRAFDTTTPFLQKKEEGVGKRHPLAKQPLRPKCYLNTKLQNIGV